MSARDMTEQQVQRALPRARIIIAAAERTAKRTFTTAERWDALRAGTGWGPTAITAIVEALSPKRYLIRLDGQGGELDRREADKEDHIHAAVIELVRHSVLAPGDVIRIIDTRPE